MKRFPKPTRMNGNTNASYGNHLLQPSGPWRAPYREKLVEACACHHWKQQQVAAVLVVNASIRFAMCQTKCNIVIVVCADNIVAVPIRRGFPSTIAILRGHPHHPLSYAQQPTMVGGIFVPTVVVA